LSPPSNPKPRSARHLFAILLSVCLGLFLLDGVVSFTDDSLTLLGWLHPLSALRGLTSFFALLVVVGVYVLIGLTPMVPKRLFLPIPAFVLVTTLGVLPLAIYYFERLPLISWGLSACQVTVGLAILHVCQGKPVFRWPLVPVDRLGTRSFSWLNLSVFVLVNVLVLLPAIVFYVFLCTALTVGHFSDGFMALRPGGLSVQVRRYVRHDGKTIELFPMAHVADARFYHKVSQTFPTNSIILMEGVTDDKNLLTNKISYRRMAKSLGLSEQRQEFVPSRGEIVDADVDVDVFSRDTIDFLNLVMLVHARGLTPENLQKVMQYSPPAHLDEELINDLLRKRNQHVVEQIQSHLSESDNIMVPWGVAHMPGIAREIQKAGFRLDQSQEYTLIQFRRNRNQTNAAGP
jgi:hypothetical protein